METSTITNPAARKFIELINDVRADWEAKKKGRDLSGVIMTVAMAYPEDKHAILQMFQTKPVRKVQGKARDATPPAPRPGQVNVAKCPSCPESVVDAVGAGRDSTTPTAKPDTSHLHTKEGVIKHFGDDADALTVVAKGLDINVGNSGKPATIARKIALYYRENGNK